MPIITKEGLYKDTTNEDYHASPGLSNSKMSLLLPPSCPANFKYHEELPHKDTNAFDVGTAVHTLCFEPKKFSRTFYTVTEIPKRNSNLGKAAHKAMIETADGRVILDSADCDLVKGMSTNIQNHAVWKSLMRRVEEEGVPPCIEYSLAWNDADHGVMLRSRPDFFTNTLIIDLKTTKDSSPMAFSRAVAEYGYHRQAALACDGLTKLTGRTYDQVMLFVVDKNPPHFVRCYVIHQAAIDQGRMEYKEAARIYSECLYTNVWPGYPEVIEEIDIPSWAYRDFAA